MIAKRDNSLRVSTIGLSQQSINALRMFFHGPCMDSYVLSDDKNADVSIIDMDIYDSKQVWKNYRNKYPNRPTILESIKESNVKDGVFLRKPIDSKLLKSALNAVRTQLQSISGSESQKTEIRKTNKKAQAQQAQKSFRIKKDISKKIIANMSDNIPEYHDKIQTNKNQKNFEAPRPAKRSLSLVEKIRQTDNGNLAAKNMTRLNTKKLAKKKIKGIANTNIPSNTSGIKVIDLIKETKNTQRINLIPATNPTIQIEKINPETIFDKTVDKYMAEENVTVSDTEKTLNATSDVPLIDGGFNLKDQNPNLSKDNLLPAAPIQLNIKDAVKKLEELDTSPDTHINVKTNLEIEDKERIYYNPGNYLQGYLKEAFKLAQLSEKNVLVQGLLLSITVIYQTKQVFLKPGSESSLAVSERSLFALSSIPITRENVKILVLSDSNSDEICKEDGLLLDYDPFMWKLATRASQGRIPEGTDLNRHMYLGQMPNIPKSKLSANALKIASLWAEEPCTLSMTAQTLDIPRREVFIFLSAAWALDLLKFSNLYIEPEFRIGGMDKYIEKQALKKDSLFRKIIKKVRSPQL